MALDGISAAAGILGIAQIGMQLAASIPQSVSTVKATDKELKAIQPDISAIGFVIKQTRDHFHSHAKHYTTGLVKELQTTLKDTNGTLYNVKDLLDKLSGGTGLGRPLLTDRLDWAFNKREKMMVLLADLGRRKAILTLMLGVAALEKRMASTGDDDMIGIQKLTVDASIKAKDDAAQKYEDLARSFALLQKKIESAAHTFPAQRTIALPDLGQLDAPMARQRMPNDCSEINYMTFDSMGGLPPGIAHGPSSRVPMSLETKGTEKGTNLDSQAQGEDEVTSCLVECATAIDDLGDRIYSATKWWRREKTMDQTPIVSPYEATAEAIMNLRSRIGRREVTRPVAQTLSAPAPSIQQSLATERNNPTETPKLAEVHKEPTAKSQPSEEKASSHVDIPIAVQGSKKAYISCFCGNEDDDGGMITCDECGDPIHTTCSLPVLEEKS